MSKNIKEEFGVFLRQARDAKRMSRATLACRLGVSPKTVQSWEMGRTFIERLDLFPKIEAELECSLSLLIAKAAGSTIPVAVSDGERESEALELSDAMGEKLATRLGPLSPSFSLVKAGPVDESPDECESATAAAPLIKPSAFLNPMANLKSREVVGHVVFPRNWIPRAGIIAATRMGDSAMMPMIPLGATVVIDVRPVPLEKAVGLIAAIGYASRGLRVRRIEKSMTDDRYFGVSITEHARAKMPIRSDKGDRVIGLVVGVLAQIN